MPGQKNRRNSILLHKIHLLPRHPIFYCVFYCDTPHVPQHCIAREARDAAIDKLRDTATKKISSIESRLQTAEGQLAKQKAESSSAAMQAGVSVLGGLLGAFFGRKTGLGSITRGTSAIGKATGAYKQRQDVANADAKVSSVAAEIETARAELEAGIATITASFDPATLPLETESIKPAKTDVKVQSVALLWLPCDARGEKAW